MARHQGEHRAGDACAGGVLVTVAELIAKLQTLPQDAHAVILDADELCDLEIQMVELEPANGRVVIGGDYNQRARP